MENNQRTLHKELDLIQAVVNRMAANSFEIKKWSLSIVAIVLALGKDELENPTHLSTLVVVIGITILAFWFLDAYFLRMERMYRKLYEYVIANQDDPNRLRYNLNVGPYVDKVASHMKVMFSISLVPFYGIQGMGMVLFVLLYASLNPKDNDSKSGSLNQSNIKEKNSRMGNSAIDILNSKYQASNSTFKNEQNSSSKKLKIFISYAHKDDQWRNKLRNAILALELSTNHPIEVFDDLSLRAGKDINEGLLKEQLEKSEIVIFLVSPDFLRSIYCREKEIPLALSQRDSGNTQILPVVIEAIPGYNTLPFGHIASTPKRLQSIKGSQDEREAWHEVYQDLEAMIKEHYSKK